MNTQGNRARRFAVLALGVAAAGAALIPAAAVGKPPSCAISNDRNHTGYGVLQDAVDAAKAGDTLEIKGTCVGSTSVDRDITLKGIVNKPFPGPPTLDGNHSGRVLDITAGKATIRDLVITNGRTDGDGGGIIIDAGASAALVNTTVRANTAGPDPSAAASRLPEKTARVSTCC